MTNLFSVSGLRNELYIYDEKENGVLFFLQGDDYEVDFTKMSNDEIQTFLLNNFQDVIKGE